ncbi:MAG: hypothetical protein PHT95_02300 [Candidatus Omnitrophica bacterium]|nr:hypothetical protein [Candidatus Omnitrophota bacterium]MDD4013796.1 hypothetical protein [Candidatus Omnitrophota bacterium]
MTFSRPFFLLIAAVFLSFGPHSSFGDITEEGSFSAEDSERFAKDLSSSLSRAWKKWQDTAVIENVEVESSRGSLPPGGVKGPWLNAVEEVRRLDDGTRSRHYYECLIVAAKAIDEAMRTWQKGYSHANIPFPQGASCLYTLTPCRNVPVTVATGKASGDASMSEKALYNSMRYNSTCDSVSALSLFRAVSRTVSEVFEEWESFCCIEDIQASGGVAPQPSPMGTGPGPVRAAKGKGGKFKGAYITEEGLYRAMMVELGKR